MSTLIVLLPSGDALTAERTELPAMPFALFDRKGEPLHSGWACTDALPKAGATVLVVAARDTLLLNVTLPPVTGLRLQRMLPNAVEEHLIQDAQRCHIAIDPAPLASGERCVAVLDHEWFGAVVDRFSALGHRELRAVPLARCIPLHEAVAESELAIAVPAATTVLIVGREQTDETHAALQGRDAGWMELAVRQGSLGFGMSVNATELDATLAGLAEREQLEVYDLAVASMQDSVAATSDAPGMEDVALAVRTLPWVRVAGEALACRFNLCQFGFANPGRTRSAAAGFRRWRVALGLVAASLAVSLLAVNVQWLQLRHRRDALNAEMTQIVKAAFPGTTMVLGPHEQIALNLARMRREGGELRDDDFLMLAAGLARALPPTPSTAIADLNYSGGTLDVSFKPGTDIDEDGLKRRCAAHGLAAQEDNGKWTLKPAQSKPH